MAFELVASCTQPVANTTVTRRQNALALFQAYAEKALVAGAPPKGLEQSFAAPRSAGLFSEYPFGTDLTREEIELTHALRWLKENTRGKVAKLLTVARAFAGGVDAEHRGYLDRLRLAEPADFGQKLTARLVSLALRATAAERRA